jgi:putative endonuclease
MGRLPRVHRHGTRRPEGPQAPEAGRDARLDRTIPVSDAWVYMLRCRDGSLYTGWTNDLDRRLASHRAGKASRYTASRLPVELALAMSMSDRTAARREEARIKRLPRSQKLELITRLAVARSHVINL